MNNVMSLISSLDMFEKTFSTTWEYIPKYAKAFLPYNYYKKDNNYILELALAGYSKEQLEVIVKDDYINIKSKVDEKVTEPDYMIYNKIARRAFDFLFPIASMYKVTDVLLKDGILKIIFERNTEAIKRLDIRVA